MATTTVRAIFTQSVDIGFPWDKSAPMVRDYKNKPSRVRGVRITFTWSWTPSSPDPDWYTSVRVTGARIKQDGESYDENRDITSYARTQLAALLSKLVAENRPWMLPEVNYSSNAKRASE